VHVIYLGHRSIAYLVEYHKIFNRLSHMYTSDADVTSEVAPNLVCNCLEGLGTAAAARRLNFLCSVKPTRSYNLTTKVHSES
jgi:hypothetical protein